MHNVIQEISLYNSKGFNICFQYNGDILITKPHSGLEMGYSSIIYEGDNWEHSVLAMEAYLQTQRMIEEETHE